MRSFIKEDRGSFTIEASLVFPGFLLFTLICVFFCIIVFQIGTANFVAQKAASELAYVWNNSHKDLESGYFDKSQYTGLSNGDGLYWRITDSGVLQIFGLNGFPGSKSLAGVKKEKVASKYSGSIKVGINDIQYNSILVNSEVSVKAKSSLYVPNFISKVVGSEVVGTSSRTVTETPELIRTFNFSKYFWSEFGLSKKISRAIESIKGFFGG